MSNESDLKKRIEDLEATVSALRHQSDWFELYNLCMESAYRADANLARFPLYTEDGTQSFIFKEAFPEGPDWGPVSEADVTEVKVRERPANWADKLVHAQARGLSHFPSMPHIVVDGDRARMMNYQMLSERDPVATAIEVPPHGVVRGFRVITVIANLFDCVKAEGRWKIKARTVRVMGGEETRTLMAQWAATAAPDEAR